MWKVKFFIENDCAYIDFGQQNFKIEGKMTGTSIKCIHKQRSIAQPEVSALKQTESVIYHETPTSNSKRKMKQPSVSTNKSRRNAVEKRSWNDVWRMVQSMERDESKVYHCGSLIAHIINWQTKQVSNVISKAY